ncbi:hypothetical protein ZIOFF_071566 [Zingiber officinale]|uniref:Cytochrome c oxidase subunit Vb n=1 Tax=Zingiber officinale TaxID=94328 RepID=A0A8J5EQL0_ZINOF|nr:hypothetical protein ZIOFF_071566 [Zingiber officinale]
MGGSGWSLKGRLRPEITYDIGENTRYDVEESVRCLLTIRPGKVPLRLPDRPRKHSRSRFIVLAVCLHLLPLLIRFRQEFLDFLFSLLCSGDGKLKKRAEDAMPIAAGIERVELEAELEVKKRFENIDEPVGPFGTKEAPAIIQSRYDKRIVGCPGGEGEDEHHVIWFWLEKGKPHECPICSQYFVLEVVGKGGPPP